MKLIDPYIWVKSIIKQIEEKDDLRFHNEEYNFKKLGFIIDIDNTTQHLRLSENYSNYNFNLKNIIGINNSETEQNKQLLI